jgi:hypothetical protein
MLNTKLSGFIYKPELTLFNISSISSVTTTVFPYTSYPQTCTPTPFNDLIPLNAPLYATKNNQRFKVSGLQPGAGEDMLGGMRKYLISIETKHTNHLNMNQL